ncbi:MAG: hypothetical protein CL858_11975 [Cupriavidus sp.]|nr:hypothetical protein [Cupriavidus sp.]
MLLTSGIVMLVDTASAPFTNTARSMPNPTCSPAASKPPRKSSSRACATGFHLAISLRAALTGASGSRLANVMACASGSSIG